MRELWFLVEAAVARLLIALFRVLGPVRASNLGGAVARAIGPRLPVSRVADTNLRLAFPQMDAAARRRVVRGAWDNLGRTLGEFPHLGRLPRDTKEGPGWEVRGAGIVAGVAAQGGPAIFFSGHIGNWEVLPLACASYGAPFASMFRAATNWRVDRIVAELRRSASGTDTPMFAKGAAGAKQAIAHLRAGGFLGLLMDQKMNDGIEATLFGHPAMTAPSLAILALRFRCPVIPGYVRRVGPARFQLVCEPPMPFPDTGHSRSDVQAMTQAMNDTLERWVAEYPEGWLWMHRRWPKPLYAAPALADAIAGPQKKRAQQRRRLALSDAPHHLGPMQAARRIKHPRPVLDAPALRVVGAEHHPGHPKMHRRRRTHGARLQRDHQGAPDEPRSPRPPRRLPHRQQFGMGAGVVIGLGPVPRHRQQRPRRRQHGRPNGDLAPAGGGVGLFQCDRHGIHASVLPAGGAAV